MFIKYELTLSRFLCNKIAKGERAGINPAPRFGASS